MSCFTGAGFNDDLLRPTRAASVLWRPVLAALDDGVRCHGSTANADGRINGRHGDGAELDDPLMCRELPGK
jgi:hypothetical protein